MAFIKANGKLIMTEDGKLLKVPEGTSGYDFKPVSTEPDQNLSDSEKTNARNNIGIGNFDGTYGSLLDKPNFITINGMPITNGGNIDISGGGGTGGGEEEVPSDLPKLYVHFIKMTFSSDYYSNASAMFQIYNYSETQITNVKQLCAMFLNGKINLMCSGAAKGTLEHPSSIILNRLNFNNSEIIQNATKPETLLLFYGFNVYDYTFDKIVRVSDNTTDFKMIDNVYETNAISSTPFSIQNNEISTVSEVANSPLYSHSIKMTFGGLYYAEDKLSVMIQIFSHNNTRIDNVKQFARSFPKDKLVELMCTGAGAASIPDRHSIIFYRLKFTPSDNLLNSSNPENEFSFYGYELVTGEFDSKVVPQTAITITDEVRKIG